MLLEHLTTCRCSMPYRTLSLADFVSRRISRPHSKISDTYRTLSLADFVSRGPPPPNGYLYQNCNANLALSSALIMTTETIRSTLFSMGVPRIKR